MNFTDAITNQDHHLTTNHFIDDVIQSQLQMALTIHFIQIFFIECTLVCVMGILSWVT